MVEKNNRSTIPSKGGLPTNQGLPIRIATSAPPSTHPGSAVPRSPTALSMSSSRPSIGPPRSFYVGSARPPLPSILSSLAIPHSSKVPSTSSKTPVTGSSHAGPSMSSSTVPRSSQVPYTASKAPMTGTSHAGPSVSSSRSVVPKITAGGSSATKTPLVTSSASPSVPSPSQKSQAPSTTGPSMPPRAPTPPRVRAQSIRSGNGTAMPRGSVMPPGGSNARQPTQQGAVVPANSASNIPRGTRSIFTSPNDTAMAARQTRINTLPPNDRVQQEQWAQRLIQRMGACPVGFDWTRERDGYRCNGGTHAVTDELLAEGLGALYKVETDWAMKIGPFYPVDGRWMINQNGVWQDWTIFAAN